PIPVFEDAAAWLWRHHPAEAAKLRLTVLRDSRTLGAPRQVDWQQLDGWESIANPAGWALPLDCSEEGWRSENWVIPGESEFSLLPGESAIGLRLPLHRLPTDALRRAITAEIRDGEFTIFLPPMPDFDRFSELVARVEQVTQELDLPPVALEGYPPIFDPAWECLSLASDPGVIEVNLPPAVTFSELCQGLRTLHESATSIGLCARKLAFNGRRFGTGGGAHILFGGPSLEDNPFVQRPHLLASFIRFLGAHPSLSYCFTGAYLGPSCQAPRPDETIPGLLEELEIALGALDTLRAPADPQFIDRLLRSLLLDWHGNTHRAELCVDKFCNPFSPGGRLGVIELRAVEMMPELEMNLAVNLLFRGLLTVMMEHRVTGPFPRHGMALHDRFLLPLVIQQDFEEVLEFLSSHGIDLPMSWFRPIFEFRMPLLGAWRSDGLEFELRQALEIWSAMGDSGGGTSRKVDAATDRIQLRLSGERADQFDVAVNGWKIPLKEAAGGQRFAGVRFQAFTNDYGLNPHLRPRLPLQIEVVDRESGLIRRAMEYSPWLLEGGYYPGRPRDEAEARVREARRFRLVPDCVGSRAEFRSPADAGSERATFDLRLRRE
ncbi:MAG TPA: transglutaminase, partial [Verrucomicrobiales bacterium]|nr:transglutaminase [Verrucomicrobiales bacterium]